MKSLLIGTLAATALFGQVTYERLLKAPSEPENWMTYSGSYKSWRYSKLDQINRQNVKNLKVAWVYQMPVTHRVETPPLVVDGVMYVLGRNDAIVALDAATGQRQWSYFYETTPVPGAPPSPVRLPAPTNRGVGLGHGHVYFGTQDNYVVALDAATGKGVWRTHVEDAQAFGCRINSAPLVAGAEMMMGSDAVISAAVNA